MRQFEFLRTLETYAYQVAYYVLDDEDLAIDATKNALLELSRDGHFFTQSPTTQDVILRKTVMKQSIKARQTSPGGKSSNNPGYF
jgi:hypothetical protein